MGDNLNRYKKVRKGLDQIYSTPPKGNLARNLNTLAGMISGIIGSNSCQLPHIASKIPNGTKVTSTEKKLKRLISNEKVDLDVYFLPFIEQLIKNLGLETIYLAIDGSGVGRGCVTLSVNLIYKKRAIPIFWIVRKGKKGHFKEDYHIEVMEQVHQIIPESTKKVIVLGDGEFDGVEFQKTLNGWGWYYVLRTGKNINIYMDGIAYPAELLGSTLLAGTHNSYHNIEFTDERYLIKKLVIWLEPGNDGPLYLVSNLSYPRVIMRYYSKRFTIETFFSDHKSRGFNIQKSHLSDPHRLRNLMIATCLAYIWMIYLGVEAVKKNWVEYIHRKDRCDLSIFQLGLRLLNYLIDHDKLIPISFTMAF